MTWTSESNSDCTFSNFASVIGTTESAGSWLQDYEACCSANNIDPCPFFKTADSSPSSSCCKLINTAVDVASWRAMLVAAGTKNSNVNEIVCHHVRMNKQHLSDLHTFIKVAEGLVSIKLDYIDFSAKKEETESVTSSLGTLLLPLMGDMSNIKFLSLKGNKLDESFVTSFSETLPLLPLLEGLNLSLNDISDQGVDAIFKVLPFCISLRKVSLKSNPVNGTALLNGITELIHGQPLGGTGEASLKTLQKLVTDKNKQIQALNKTKKKAGLPEWPELSAPASRVLEDSNGGTSRVLNRNIKLFDFSFCSFDVSVMKSFVETAISCTQTGPDMTSDGPLLLRMQGIDTSTCQQLTAGSGDKGGHGDIFSGKISVEC